MFKEFFEKIIDLLLPKTCVYCGRLGEYICEQCIKKRLEPKEQKLCHVCKHRVNKRGLFVHTDCIDKTDLDGVFVCYKYNKYAKKLLKLIKFDGYFGLVESLAMSMEWYYNNLPIGYDLAVPVPLYKSRLDDRGFNQSEKILNILTWNHKNILKRIKNTKQQASLNKDLRTINMVGAFEVAKNISVKGKTVLLFDDVFTTGSTLENCAKTLKNAGAKKVFAMTWAGGGLI
jgi:ComF family protein